ncbi:MAG: hypothetical protein WCI05_05595 [Myxococcales bacterium]
MSSKPETPAPKPNDKALPTSPTSQVQSLRILVPTSTTDPSPVVKVVLGEPEHTKGKLTFGFPGVSIKTTQHMYLNVAGHSLWFLESPVNLMASAEWYQYIGGEAFTSGEDRVSMLSGALLTLAAGPAPKRDKPLDRGGAAPARLTPNRLELQNLLRPLKLGVQTFEAQCEKNFASLSVGLGRQVPSHAKPKLAWAKILAGLLGIAPREGTDASYIDRFARGDTGLLGLLNKLNNRLDGLDKRVQEIPILQPLLTKVKKAKGLVDSAIDTYNAAKAAVERAPWAGVPDDWKKTKAKTIDPIAAAEGTSGLTPFVKIGEATLGVTDAMKTLTKSIRQTIAEVRDVVDSAASLVASVGKFLDLTGGDPSSMGLFSKEGITLATPDRIVQYAADGFSFISAETGKDKDPTGLLGKVLALPDKGLDWVDKKTKALKSFPWKAKGLDAVPGFRVRTTDLDLQASTSANLTVFGTGASVRVESAGQTELAAMHEVLVSSRNAPLFLLGDEVVIGTTGKHAVTISEDPVVVNLLKGTSTSIASARKEWNDAKAKQADAEDAVSAAKKEHKEASKEAVAAAALNVKAKEILRDVAVETTRVMELALGSAVALARLARAGHTELPKGFGSADAQSHAPAKAVSIGAWSDVNVYAGQQLDLASGEKVTLTASQASAGAPSVALSTKSKLGIVQATVALTQKVEIKIGLTTVVEVGDGNVVVKLNGSEVVRIDATGVVIKDPATSQEAIATKAGNVSLSGTTVQVNGQAILLG